MKICEQVFKQKVDLMSYVICYIEIDHVSTHYSIQNVLCHI